MCSITYSYYTLEWIPVGDTRIYNKSVLSQLREFSDLFGKEIDVANRVD